MTKRAANTPAKRKRGGQPKVPAEQLGAVVEDILARMAAGHTLSSICKTEGYPAAPTVRLWAIKDEPPGFAERYARARQLQADAIAEDALDIADECKDPIKARLQVDTRKWLASKINPAKFSDKQQLEHSGPNGGPVEFTFALDHAGRDDGSDEAATG